ncbi:MAG: SDR family oxidoreductase [Massilia sp.]
MNTTKTALVLGATGGIGGALARELVARGWRVRAMIRRPAAAPAIDGVDWVGGDAMRREDVVAASAGAALIVHAVNPAGYRNWETLVLPMLESTIAAARASGARILLPGTIYNYGSGSAPVLRESSPQRPSSRKGAIRVRMEEMLREAAADGVRSLVVRAGDFFGPGAANNWFAQGMVTPGRALTALVYPGSPGVGHGWAYLPDLASTMARLVEQGERLGAFDVFHFRGHWDADGTAMTAAIERAAGRALTMRRLPWFVLRLLAPFKVLFREMLEMRYLWQEPFELDNAKLLRFLGSEPHTPLDQAVRLTLEGLGCLEAEEGCALPA